MYECFASAVSSEAVTFSFYCWLDCIAPDIGVDYFLAVKLLFLYIIATVAATGVPGPAAGTRQYQ